MKFTIFTPFALVCAACVGVIAGERVVWINGGSGIHADHPQKCWSATLNREFAIGEEFNDGDKCELLRCRPDLRFQKRVYVYITHFVDFLLISAIFCFFHEK